MTDKPPVNFIREIMAFDNACADKLTKGPIALWYALFNEFNRNGYAQWFQTSISWLESRSGLSATAVYKARNVLKQEGLIDFKKGKTKKNYAKYRITLLVDGDFYAEFGVEKSVDKSVGKSTDKSVTDINNKLINNTSCMYTRTREEKTVIPILKLGGDKR